MQRIRHHARRLRREATDAERHLWHHLRRRQLAGVRFRRQHPIAGFIVDFACIEAGLVVELDGGQHADRAAYDTRRTRRLEAQGYRVLRFWNDDVFMRTEDVLAEIHRHLVSQECRPHPSPPLPAGEAAHMHGCSSGAASPRAAFGSSPCGQGEVGRGLGTTASASA